MYKYFFFRGRLAAARALASRAPLANISLQATKMDLSLADSAEVSEDEYEGEPDGFPAEEQSKSISPSKYRRRSPARASTQRNYSEMRQQAQTWRELEQLTGILETLEEWSAVAEEAERYDIMDYGMISTNTLIDIATMRNAQPSPSGHLQSLSMPSSSLHIPYFRLHS